MIAGSDCRSPHHSARKKRCHFIYHLGIRRPKGLTMHGLAPLIRSGISPFGRSRSNAAAPCPNTPLNASGKFRFSSFFLCVLWHFGTTRTLARSDLVLRNSGSYLNFHRYTLLQTRVNVYKDKDLLIWDESLTARTFPSVIFFV